MKNSPLLFLDTETLGLDENAPIWEVAAIRVDEGGIEGERCQLLVQHEQGEWLKTLPESFQDDYRDRFNPDLAWAASNVIPVLQRMARGRAVVCGSNPSFDMTRLEKLAQRNGMDSPDWHYHAMDIPTLMHGYLIGKGVWPAPPWKSDFLSQAVGIDPRDFDRHTAMGDCEWTLTMWREIGG